LGEHFFGPVKKAVRGEVQFDNGPGSLYLNVAHKPGAWFAFSGDKGGYGLELIIWQMDCSFADALSWAKNWLGGDLAALPPPKPRPASHPKEESDEERIAAARKIENRSEHAFATPAESYLRRRGITRFLPSDIRYLAAWRDLPSRMISVSRNLAGEIQAVQSVYITADGRRAGYNDDKKKTRGAPKGAAVMFTGLPGRPVVLAEGVETALSIWQATGYPTLATLGLSNMGEAPVPPGRRAIVASDRNPAGSPAEAATQRAVDRLLERGFRVFLAIPPIETEKADFNNVLILSGEEAIRRAIEEAVEQFPPRPHFNTNPLRVLDAQAKQTSTITTWLDKAVHHPEEVSQVSIKSAAGLGKSRDMIRALARCDDVRRLNVEIYCPTHDLCGEEADELEKDAPDLRVLRIRGRGFPGMCERADKAEQLGKLGFPVQSSLCRREREDGKLEFCPHYHSCKYQAQFFIITPAIRVMAHEYLTLERMKDSPKPDLAIIDESFYRQAVKSSSFPAERLAEERTHYFEPDEGFTLRDLERISRLALKALHSENPKEFLKAQGVTKADLQNCASAEWAGVEKSPVSPGMLDTEQFARLAAFKRSDAQKVWRFWSLLAEEFDRPGDLVRIQFKEKYCMGDDHRDRVFLFWKKDIRIKGIPVLTLDADADHEITKKFLPHVETTEIAVKRKAKITQVSDTPCSKRRLLGKFEGDKEFSARRLAEVQALIDIKAKTGRVLAIATKEVAERLKAPAGSDIAWFGNILGKDIWKDFDTAIIVGRELAPIQAYEAQARALFWNEEKPLILTDGKSPDGQADKGGGWVKETRRYRMKDDSLPEVEVAVHPDRRVQSLVEQGCECQSAQGLDRLRLVHSVKDKEIIILSSVVLDVDVDELKPWRDVVPGQLDIALAWRGVLPFSPADLAKNFPDLFQSARAARYHLEENPAKFTTGTVAVVYQHPGPRMKLCRALVSLEHEDLKAALESVVGPVVHFEIENPPPANEKDERVDEARTHRSADQRT